MKLTDHKEKIDDYFANINLVEVFQYLEKQGFQFEPVPAYKISWVENLKSKTDPFVFETIFKDYSDEKLIISSCEDVLTTLNDDKLKKFKEAILTHGYEPTQKFVSNRITLVTIESDKFNHYFLDYNTKYEKRVYSTLKTNYI